MSWRYRKIASSRTLAPRRIVPAPLILAVVVLAGLFITPTVFAKIAQNTIDPAAPIAGKGENHAEDICAHYPLPFWDLLISARLW